MEPVCAYVSGQLGGTCHSGAGGSVLSLSIFNSGFKRMQLKCAALLRLPSSLCLCELVFVSFCSFVPFKRDQDWCKRPLVVWPLVSMSSLCACFEQCLDISGQLWASGVAPVMCRGTVGFTAESVELDVRNTHVNIVNL